MNPVMYLIDILRWIIAVPLLLVWLYFATTNLRFLFQNFRVGLDAGPAPVTIVGGVAGCFGLLILPWMELTDRVALLWAPLFLDLGSAPFYLSMLALAIWQGMNKRAWRNQPDYIEG